MDKLNLKQIREDMGLTLRQMARRCDCSATLLGGVEDGWITHPHIASRIAAEYGLDVKGYNALVPKKHREKALPKPVSSPDERTWGCFIKKRSYYI